MVVVGGGILEWEGNDKPETGFAAGWIGRDGPSIMIEQSTSQL